MNKKKQNLENAITAKIEAALAMCFLEKLVKSKVPLIKKWKF